MARLDLSRIPDPLLKRLESLAREHGRDLESEAVDCLERGLSNSEEAEARLKGIRELRGKMAGTWITEEAIRAARDEGRA